MSKDTVRVGTRESQLATWQANFVSDQLNEIGVPTELVFIKTEGDKVLDTPLPLMGGKGVFTKALDDAMLAGEVDIAVHSLKDIPTVQPGGLTVGGVLERADVRDALVARDGTEFMEREQYNGIIATSSTRRRAQWLNRFTQHDTTDIRGNVNTRLRKLSESNWDGAIFAAAGLQRIDLDHHISAFLDWMLPAPAQGAVAVMCRDDDSYIQKVLDKITHTHTKICTGAERDFLHILEAGCSAPVGALAVIDRSVLSFKGVVLSEDGQKRIDVERDIPVHELSTTPVGEILAKQALEQGAGELLD